MPPEIFQRYACVPRSNARTASATSFTRIMARIGLLLVVMLLSACGLPTAEDSAQPAPRADGDISPEAVAQNFFEDLSEALKDPRFGRDEVRSYWVERLSGYFAPDERDDQRTELSNAFNSFADGLRQLTPDQTLSLALTFKGIEKLSEDDSHAFVRPIGAQIDLQIAHTTARGLVIDFDQQIGLEKIIGRPDGSVPTLKVGGRWFLTEG